jgi:hypothetical protein
MIRRKKAPQHAEARATVKLKAPAGCGPFKRDGRRYVPSSDGVVAVPIGLVENLLAHGFAPLIGDEAPKAATSAESPIKRGKKHGGG